MRARHTTFGNATVYGSTLRVFDHHGTAARELAGAHARIESADHMHLRVQITWPDGDEFVIVGHPRERYWARRFVRSVNDTARHYTERRLQAERRSARYHELENAVDTYHQN